MSYKKYSSLFCIEYKSNKKIDLLYTVTLTKIKTFDNIHDLRMTVLELCKKIELLLHNSKNKNFLTILKKVNIIDINFCESFSSMKKFEFQKEKINKNQFQAEKIDSCFNIRHNPTKILIFKKIKLKYKDFLVLNLNSMEIQWKNNTAMPKNFLAYCKSTYLFTVSFIDVKI